MDSPRQVGFTLRGAGRSVSHCPVSPVGSSHLQNNSPIRGNFRGKSGVLPKASNSAGEWELLMPDQTNAKWNTPKGMLNSRIDDVDDYVLVGKKSDGTHITLSNGDASFASKLLQESGIFQDQESRQLTS